MSIIDYGVCGDDGDWWDAEAVEEIVADFEDEVINQGDPDVMAYMDAEMADELR